MNGRIFILLCLVFAILQGPLLPPVLLEGFALLSLISTDREQIRTDRLVVLFFSGLLFDLIQDRTIGVTSLIFGVAAVVFQLLGRSGIKNPVFFAVGAVLANIVRAQILFGQIFVIPTIICGLLTYFYFKFTNEENVVYKRY